jgi:Mor family transcriptional regulator
MKTKDFYDKRNKKIYDEYQQEGVSYGDLAKKYNLSRCSIMKIVKSVKDELKLNNNKSIEQTNELNQDVVIVQ